MQLELQPKKSLMYRALLERDSAFEGVFVVGITSTGIFCRPTCPARKPKRENVEFFANPQAALLSGYRPCKRCQPQTLLGAAPSWLEPVLKAMERAPAERWTDSRLRALDADPVRVRRWFQKQHGMTFHAYCRKRQLGHALGHLQNGGSVIDTAFNAGFESLSGFGEAFQKQFGHAPAHSRAQVQLVVTRILTPLGPMLAAANQRALVLLEFVDRRALETQLKTLARHFQATLTPGANQVLKQTEVELGEYFAGRRKQFEVPLEAPGTAFQEKVWAALRQIPYGETRSYLDIAKQVRLPRGFRAVARANGDNRLAIVIPCHRVIASDGSLSGYGGQVWRKQALLALEAR